MKYIKQFFSKAFDIFVRKAVNFGAVSIALLAGVMLLTGWVPPSIVKIGVNIIFTLMAISMIGYLLQDVLINCQLVAFVGRIATKVEATKAEMKNSFKYKAFFMAEALAKDEATIKYLDKVNIVSAYDTLIFGARNFGYVLLPIMFSFGLNTEAIGITFWPFTLLWKVSLVVFMVRYLGVLAVTLAATGLSEKYNEVLDFYSEKGDH